MPLCHNIEAHSSIITRGNGRMIYCMQAHEDKISPKCAYELERETILRIACIMVARS